MEKKRAESYKQFIKYLEYPVVIFGEEDGALLDMNYEAQTILGHNVHVIKMQPDKVLPRDHFWDRLHQKKSIIWHRILLEVDGVNYYVSGLVNEFLIEEKRHYMVLFERRSDLNLGSITLEQMINNTAITAFYLYPKDDKWHVRYVSKNVNQYGYTREEFYNGKILFKELIYEKDYERVIRELVSNLMKREDDFKIYFSIWTEARKLKPLMNQIHVVRDDYNNVEGIEILSFDVSERRKKMDEIRYLQSALGKSKSVVVVKRYAGKDRTVRYISSNAHILGMNVEALRLGTKLTEDYIIPEDRDDVIDTIYRAVEREVDHYIHNYRMLGDDGQYRWVRSSISVTRIDEDTADIEFLITDVTAEKQETLDLIEKAKGIENRYNYIMEGNGSVYFEEEEIEQMLEEQKLDSLVEACAKAAGLYSTIVNMEGKRVTTPAGAREHMGDFYDLFERPAFRQRYHELIEGISKYPQAYVMNFQNGSQEVKLIGAPIRLEEQQIGVWVMCAYTEAEKKKLEKSQEVLGEFARRISTYCYNSLVVTKESRRSRIAELKLKKEMEGRTILTDALTVMDADDNATLDMLMEKAGRFLEVEKILTYEVNQEKETYDLTHHWERVEEDLSQYSKNLEHIFKKPLHHKEEIIIEKQHVVCTAYHGDMEIGKVVFVSKDTLRQWNDIEIHLIQSIRTLVQEILIKREGDGSLRSVNKGLIKAYDYMEDPVFIKDVMTNNILYANPAANAMFKTELKGTDSKRIVVDLDEHFNGIHVIRKRFISNKNSVKWQSYIKQLDKIMDVNQIKIEWLDGRDAAIVILKEHVEKRD